MTDLTPGPEMDRAVAEAVGLVVQAADRRWSDDTCRVYRAPRFPSVFRPSTDIAHAIEALEATGHSYEIIRLPRGFEPKWRTFQVVIKPLYDRHYGNSVSIPEAACRAILAWAEAKEQNDA